MLGSEILSAADSNETSAPPPPSAQPAKATNIVQEAGVSTNWLARPLSLTDCLDLALQQNSAVLKSRKDIEAVHGVIIQTRAIAVPKLAAQGQFKSITDSSIDKFPFSQPGSPITIPISYPTESWGATVQLTQSIYEGGRIKASLRTARLLKEQALLNYQTVEAETVLQVRTAYAAVLVTSQQIEVQKAAINLLEQELADATRRFEAGTVPRFNVLRAEVEVANARPRLFKAQNAYRIAKNNLANVLGYHIPKEIWEDIPLQLTGKLEAEPIHVELPAALTQALSRRPELGVLRKAESLRKEGITMARAGYKPSVQMVGGFSSRNSSFSTDLANDVSGLYGGAQLSWNFFDGMLTKGKVDEARALYEKAQLELDEATRQIELEVRSAYSTLIEAQQVLESQKKVQEQAEEAVRLARARSEAGTGTQLDLLNAQTSLTEARTTQVVALRDYVIAQARFEKAIGLPEQSSPK